MFLTQDDLIILTGYKRACKQIEYLKKIGIPYWVNRFGKPVVSRDMEAKKSAPRLGVVR